MHPIILDPKLKNDYKYYKRIIYVKNLNYIFFFSKPKLNIDKIIKK